MSTVSHAESFDRSVIPDDAKLICERLAQAGKRAWVVGGCVRDSLLGKVVSDWDIATDALPNEVMRVFPRAIPTGIAHGTVTVVLRGHHYEVTTLRGESTYSDGRRPDAVHFVDDIVGDLARRDFTINAIAVDMANGALVDPFDGRGDLERRIVRAVGNPLERFEEDGLRVLRAARFTATLEFDLDPATYAAIGPTLGTYRKVSAERVRDEWTKTMKAKKPSRAFDVMRTSGILGVSCPELLEGVGMAQNKWHSLDVWNHALACMDACVGDPILRIAALLHDVGKPRSRAFSEKTSDYTFYDHDKIGAELVAPIVQRLRFSNDEKERIVALVRHHLFHYDAWSDQAVRRWIRRVGPSRVEDLFRLNEADLRGKGEVFNEASLAPLWALQAHVKNVLEAGAALSTKDLAINGNTLMTELGLPRGRIIGQMLDELLEAVLADPSMNEPVALLSLAREIQKRGG
jgi:tRNA nucleotidyltransferase (CCA-adding enzyme)